MKSLEKLFTNDNEQKELITKISALCGLKQDIIKSVWQYTFFSVYLSLLEQKQKGINEVPIPYIGKLVLRFPDEKIREFDPERKELEPFFIMNQNFKDVIKNLRAGNDIGLVEFFKENFINKIVEQIIE